MINKTKRKATVERCGSMVVIRMIGGPDCLWLNMYLDTDTWSMTCDSDIGFYAYHWGRGSSNRETFLPFCLRWLADGGWLLRTCIGERNIDKGFDVDATCRNLREAYKNEDEDPDCDTYWLDEAIARACEFDNVDAWAAVLQSSADSLGVDLPEEWWECIERDYTPWQKRFAEICREVIVPALTSSQTAETGGAAPEAEPVRHGKWGEAEIVGYNGYHAVYARPCMLCGSYTREYKPPYCPNCGAKMDAKEEPYE